MRESMPKKDCNACAKKVVSVGIWTNALLVILKVIVGVTSGSKACIADGLHSASNIVSAFAIQLTHRITRKPGSSRFPYGYGKAEFIAAGFVSILIIAGAVALIVVSIDHLMKEPSAPPHFTAVLVALVSIGANEMMFRFMRCAGTRLKSHTIIASAWANRADCFSSLAVIIGVIGAKLGFHHLDPLAALCVVIVIIKVSVKILWDSAKALMDSSVNDLYGDEIETIVEGIEDVYGISGMKTRQIGQKIWVELDILVAPGCSIQDAHRIASRVRDALIDQVTDLEEAFVYFQPA